MAPLMLEVASELPEVRAFFRLRRCDFGVADSAALTRQRLMMCATASRSDAVLESHLTTLRMSRGVTSVIDKKRALFSTSFSMVLSGKSTAGLRNVRSRSSPERCFSRHS